VGKGPRVLSAKLEIYLVQWRRGSGGSQRVGEGQAQLRGHKPAVVLLQDVGSKEGRRGDARHCKLENALAGLD
jgi:hypothetical protein